MPLEALRRRNHRAPPRPLLELQPTRHGSRSDPRHATARSVRQSLPPLASGAPVGVGDPSERNPFLEFRDETFIALHGLGRKGAGAYAVNSDSAHCPMAGRITCELDQSRLCCTVGGRVVEVRMDCRRSWVAARRGRTWMRCLRAPRPALLSDPQRPRSTTSRRKE